MAVLAELGSKDDLIWARLGFMALMESSAFSICVMAWVTWAVRAWKSLHFKHVKDLESAAFHSCIRTHTPKEGVSAGIICHRLSMHARKKTTTIHENIQKSIAASQRSRLSSDVQAMIIVLRPASFYLGVSCIETYIWKAQSSTSSLAPCVGTLMTS